MSADGSGGAPEPPDHLRPIGGSIRWLKGFAPVGLVLLAAAALLTFVAPSALWFLLYPVLIVGGLTLLMTIVAWMMRHF
jgi:hypothetical protein